jgi:hypothetical protein
MCVARHRKRPGTLRLQLASAGIAVTLCQSIRKLTTDFHIPVPGKFYSITACRMSWQISPATGSWNDSWLYTKGYTSKRTWWYGTVGGGYVAFETAGRQVRRIPKNHVSLLSSGFVINRFLFSQTAIRRRQAWIDPALTSLQTHRALLDYVVTGQQLTQVRRLRCACKP